MKRHRLVREAHFPVMAGAEEAERDARVAGIVEQAWGDATVSHRDVEPFLRQWLTLDRIDCSNDEFEALCESARSRIATNGGIERDARGLVHHLYDDIQALERGH